jgi:3-hydroxyisobutyrate dehydrogenase-like beta-hydroxyacid dehydrogenase
MRVAVLGMGRMGGALTRRLLGTGHAVVVWNRTAARATPLLHLGASLASTPADAAAGADGAVFLSLANDDAVRQTLLGGAGALDGLNDRTVVIDSSTVAPRTSREVAGAVPGGRFLAAPIAGGPSAVESGGATFLVGGGRQWVDRLEGLFDDLAGGYAYCGEDPGAATTLKLLNNYLLMGGIAIIGEAVAAGQASGLDPTVFRNYLFSSPLVAPAFHNRIEDLLAGDHEGWFSVALGAKDVTLAIEAALDAGVNLAIAKAVKARYQAAIDAGLADKDITAVVEVARPHAD